MSEREITPPVHWYEGMFLQPQHLQQLVRAADDALHYKTRQLSPFQWGVRELEIDEEALRSGRFKVRLEAILPDGLIIQNHTRAHALERDFGEREDRMRDGERLRVYLAVPEPGRKTVETTPGEEVGYPLRYAVSPTVDVADESTGVGEAPIAFLHANVRLFFASDEEPGWRTMPIAEVGWADEAFRLTDFIAPALLVERTSPIADLVRDLCQEMRSRATEIAGGFDAAVRHQDQGRTLEARFQAFGLVSSLLPLSQMAELECYRPVDFYIALCRLLGELGTLGHGIVPSAPPQYEHTDLARTFGELAQSIRALLVPLESAYDRLTVRGEEGKFEVTDLTAEHLQRPIYVTLRGRSGTDPQALHNWVQKNCVIASGDVVRELIQRRILGIERKPVDPPPIDLRLERGTLVYSLNITEDFAEPLRAGNKLFFLRARSDSGEMAHPTTLNVYVRKDV